MSRYAVFCYLNRCKFLILYHMPIEYQVLNPIRSKNYEKRNAGSF
jgi:hypothetical protein